MKWLCSSVIYYPFDCSPDNAINIYYYYYLLSYGKQLLIFLSDKQSKIERHRNDDFSYVSLSNGHRLTVIAKHDLLFSVYNQVGEGTAATYFFAFLQCTITSRAAVTVGSARYCYYQCTAHRTVVVGVSLLICKGLLDTVITSAHSPVAVGPLSLLIY